MKNIFPYFFPFFLPAIWVFLLGNRAFAEVDITNAGMDIFTRAYQWEVVSTAGYNKDAFTGFTKKLNAAINRDSTLSALSKVCSGCDVVDVGLDQGLVAYIAKNPRATEGGGDYVSLIAPYLHARVGSAMTADRWSAMNNLMSDMITSIGTQVKGQMDAYRDVSGMGLYTDGNTDNSPYDLLDDIRRIDDILLRESPEYGSYTNTTRDDAGGLITGVSGQGAWVMGKEYQLDLASDIEKALTGGNSKSDTKKENFSGEDCDSGFCITVDFVHSNSYDNNSSQGGSSFQGLFEEGLNWITKNGDKRNLACQEAPTINFFGSNFTHQFSLKKLFSGGSISVAWKIPPFLKGFFGKGKNPENNSTTNSQKPKKDPIAKRVEDSLRSSFSRYGMNYDRPTDLLTSSKQTFENAALGFNGNNIPIINAKQALDRAQELYRVSLIEAGAGQAEAKIGDINTHSMKTMEKKFDEIAALMNAMEQYNADMNSVLAKISHNPYCKN